MKKILVVDDDQEVLETLELILELGGFEVLGLDNGEEIFDKIKFFEPDLILLDISLGHIDGRLLCEQLKASANTSYIPILLISGLYQADEISSLQHGQDDFLSKPFQMDVLLEKLATILSKQENENTYKQN
ncbi:MAG: response regulator, partial [Pedobacter sp.]|nr:response regulator [Pedobacter sp.]